ncbi:hypothetical protein J8M87_00520 [Enterococcus faecium]
MVHSDSDLILHNSSVLIDKEPKNLSQNVVHSDSDLILHNSSVLIDKEPKKTLYDECLLPKRYSLEEQR